MTADQWEMGSLLLIYYVEATQKIFVCRKSAWHVMLYLKISNIHKELSLK